MVDPDPGAVVVVRGASMIAVTEAYTNIIFHVYDNVARGLGGLDMRGASRRLQPSEAGSLMRATIFIPLATVCGVLGAPLACSSNNGGAEGSGTSTGGTGFATTSGGGSVNYVTGGSNGTGSNGSTGGATSDSTGCAQNDVPIQAYPPDIMIVQDRSLSMTDDVNDQVCAGGSLSGDGDCGSASKWSQTIAAIEAVVQATQTTVNWGLWFLGDEVAQCGASTTPVVPMTYIPQDSYTPVQTALDTNTFTGAPGTPTAAVMTSASAYMLTLTDSNPKFILLATDGEPNCAQGNLNTNDPNGATNAIKSAAAAGIATFVVGIGNVSSATSTLNMMATAGGEAQKGTATQYYAVTDTASLQAALTTIVGQALSCTISLANAPKGSFQVLISATDAAGNKVEVPSSATDGWAYTDTTKTSITLIGSYCDGLKTGTFSNFHFVYTCENGPPPVL